MKAKLIKIAVPVIGLAALGWLIFAPPARVGYAPEQPIPYSHKIHAGDYGMDCQYCHTGVHVSKKAGVPSLNTCMNCHQFSVQGSNKTAQERIKKVQDYWNKKTSPEWVRIHNMPDHVRFSHAPHVKALSKPGEPTEQACVACHGNVSEMEVVEQVEPHNMGWCVNCHRDYQKEDPMVNGPFTNCSTCHY